MLTQSESVGSHATNSSLQLVQLSRCPQHIERFLDVSDSIYRNDRRWVAPLRVDVRKLFSDCNPFFAHAEMALWVLEHQGKDLGRVVGIIDRLHLEQYHDRTAFFGFFESVEDPEVSRALLQAVAFWAAQKGMGRLLGPMNPSVNEECGLLVAGFEDSPVLMMSYNPPYYEKLITSEGFSKAKDLLAFQLEIAGCPLDRLARVVARFESRPSSIRIRPLRRRTLQQDLPKIKEVFNEAWNRNWGFVPMTSAEVDFLAARLRPLLTEGLAWIAEDLTEPVGVLVALPDFNEAIKPLKGRLLTPKIFGALAYLLGWKRPKLVRVLVLGVKERFRGRGIETLMLAESLKVGRRRGFSAAEASWVLEDNLKTRQTIELFGGKPYKTYRLYERCL